MKALIVGSVDLLIDQNFKHHKDSQYYADQMNMSLKSLNNLLKQRRGKTVAQLINERLHREALSLLLHTDMQMKRIAYELDYCDPAYFTRAFKREQGITPAEYRKLHDYI